jgi:pimeloyl-ACP methyl ester carboxylesterase
MSARAVSDLSSLVLTSAATPCGCSVPPAATPASSMTSPDAFPAFPAPALVVWAEEDRVMPPEHGRRLAALMPRGRLIEVEDSYTLIPLDQPTAPADAIRAFIQA